MKDKANQKERPTSAKEDLVGTKISQEGFGKRKGSINNFMMSKQQL